ncbi:signal peptide peptidase SppA [Photobacterium iliopiscarium]|uniref:Signal peptide peptidase SppA n=1 Tax=Photobacterium iliopiscarium TaxID=56192 RepID=A0A2T3MP10_9GAMM|nr:signal peptide peptidase SppA [Photobacterium iliopiscarium]PSV98665.1 signal peptide peptidase SppA [Photobacterium iliopiscarium]
MKAIFSRIGKFFLAIGKLINFTRKFVLNILFVLIIGAIIFALTDDDKTTDDTEPSALVLNLAGPIVEQKNYDNPLDSVMSEALGKPDVQQNVLFDVVETIRAAATDNDITGLVLNLKGMSETSLTKLRYIAKAIEEFKAAGKPVYAYGDNYSQSQYYLASYADKIFLSPDGGVMLTGYGTYTLYYKSLLAKLDVTTHVFRVGTYKSFVEPYIRDGMSAAAKEANTVWLTQLWGAFSDDVAKNRKIKPQTLTPNIDEFVTQLKSVNGDFAQLSKKLGLVDSLVTRDQMNQYLIDTFGANDKHSFKHINYYDYQHLLVDNQKPSPNKVAVIIVSGAIVDGQSSQGSAGGDTIASLLNKARFDKQVKSVILRVDSPGGSAFASEIIRNQVDALKRAGKPVVVSMSSVAASGGYWISSSADEIIAQPTTITGSIGIFAILTTFEKGLEKLGVYSDGVGTTPFSGVGVTRALPDGVAKVFQLGVDNGYQRFIGLVSKYRHMSLTQADKIAQGRVWTGTDAQQRGLVDKLGDFDTAITAAVELAKVKDYQLIWMQQPLSPVQQFFKELSGEVKVQVASMILGDMPSTLAPVTKVAKDLTSLTNFNDPNGRYAFCLNCSTVN